jgi:hypothetical protein
LEDNLPSYRQVGDGSDVNKIELPRDVQFLEDARLFIYRPRGVLSEEVVDEVIVALGKLEFSFSEPFDRFFDTLAVNEIELNVQYVIRVSLYRRFAYAGHPPVKSAILATDSMMIHYARLHALLTQDSPINVRVFQDRAQTAQWLGVPIELLAAEPSGEKHSG